MNNKIKALNDVSIERTRQSELHGDQTNLSLETLYLFLSEEHGEVAQALQSHRKLDNVKTSDKDDLYTELIQVAAVAVKMAERVLSDG